LGFSIKFNWVLQITPPENPEAGKSYEFEKPGNRNFPLDAPIDLIDPDRNAIAKIRVESFTNRQNLTTGSFIVVKVYRGNEKEVLSVYWRENQ